MVGRSHGEPSLGFHYVGLTDEDIRQFLDSDSDESWTLEVRVAAGQPSLSCRRRPPHSAPWAVPCSSPGARAAWVDCTGSGER